MVRQNWWWISVVACAAAIFLKLSAGAHADTAVKIAAGDNLDVTVFGQAELTGQFQVNGAGDIKLPMLGGVKVSGLSEQEAEDQIATLLRDGFVNAPVVTVRFQQFRPIYVTGYVGQPGAIPFRFDTSVFKAIAQAGGYRRAQPGLATNSAAAVLTAQQQLTALQATRANLIVRVARLKAQHAGQRELRKVVVDGVSPTIWENERTTLNFELAALERQLDLIDQQRPRLQESREAMERQLSAEQETIATIEARLAKLGGLRKRGLVREVTIFDLQTSRATAKSAIARLQAQLADLSVTVGTLEIQAETARSTFKRNALTALNLAREQLRDTERRIPEATQLLRVRQQQADVDVSTTDTPGSALYRFRIVRSLDGKASTLDATLMTMLQPGDVLTVERQLQGTSARSRARKQLGYSIDGQPRQLGQMTRFEAPSSARD
ncbi:MAG: polysaccharide biosynthesis/export family protein [Pseudomonadota bacterium]